jgi:uncharacterized membrane protein
MVEVRAARGTRLAPSPGENACASARHEAIRKARERSIMTTTYVEMRNRQAGRYPGEGSALVRDEGRSMLGYEPGPEPSNGIGRLAQGLGWFSVGLGLAEMASPRAVARLIGVRDGSQTRVVLRSMGARELANGLAILTRSRPANWVWARVAGDAVDLALLGQAARGRGNEKARLAAAAAAVLGVAALDVLAGRKLSRTSAAITQGAHLGAAITINRGPDEVYRYWRDLQNMPRFMDHVESVQVTGDRTSRWRTKPIAGMALEWDSEILDDRPAELIGWRSVDGDLEHWGTVRFSPAPGGRGTEVRVNAGYRPPGGVLGSALASLLGTLSETKMSNDLRRLKQLIETGEVVRSDASIHTGPHPAQPSAGGAA